MSLYLAIDAGGTKTGYLLADGERELGRVEGGSIKRLRVPAEEAEQHLDDALARLAALTGRSLAQVDCTCVGAAGNSIPLVGDWIRAELGRRVGGRLVMVNDVEIALDAAYPGESGILVLAGTGSNVLGRTVNGKPVGAGGYGPALADQGSGHRIGESALRAVFLARDEDRATTLYEAICAATGLHSYEELVAWANAAPPAAFSPLARTTAECAAAGDALALSVLQEQGRQLAHLALLVHRRIESVDGPLWKPRFAFAGSILAYVEPLRAALIETIRAGAPLAAFHPGVADALAGALWRARRTDAQQNREQA